MIRPISLVWSLSVVLFSCAALVSCGAAPTPEAAPPEKPRFVYSKGGFYAPEFYVLRDGKTGREYLVIRSVNQAGVAICPVEPALKPEEAKP